jgi:N-acyl-D-aspartate/D-glutamate deacylase
MFDLVITNGRIVDGSGSPAFMGDIAIKDGRIAAIGTITEDATDTLDANGNVVSPGFIDVHTHYDAQVFWDGALTPSCYHGVTTAFGGHCGFSIAPLSPEAAPYLLHMLARVEGMPVTSLEAGVPWDWRSFSEYLGKLDGNLGINAGFMAGHSAIRRVVMGERAVGHTATDAELTEMSALLDRCLNEGALGFSSTLSSTHNDADGQPVPSRHASNAELMEFARVTGEHAGTSIEFLPGIGMFSAETKQLMSDLSTTAQRPVNWNVLTPGDPEVVESQLDASDVARRNGGKVVALTVPQPVILRLNLYAGMVFDAMTGWAELFRLPIDERIEVLKDPARRRELDASAKSGGPFKDLADWPAMIVHATFEPENKHYEGRTIGSIAEELGKQPIDAMFDLAISEGLRTSFIPPAFGGGADESLWPVRGKLWQDERTIIGASDAGAHLDMIDTFAFSTQVLGNGVREYGVISLEQAVHQITQVPAELFGLTERGRLETGWHADIVIFDPDTVATGPVHVRTDLPMDEPRIYADAIGIDHVFVNGVQIVRDGEHTNARPGTVLRSGVDTHTPSMSYGEMS